MRDDWEKPRGKGQHLTPAEIGQIRTAFNCGRRPDDIARELQCSSRIANKYYAQFRTAGSPVRRRPAPEPDIRSVAVAAAPRFYKSTFEL